MSNLSFNQLINELIKLNPSVEIKTGDQVLDPLYFNRIFSSVEPSKLVLPTGFEYNEKNGINNKHTSSDGAYLSIKVEVIKKHQREIPLISKAERNIRLMTHTLTQRNELVSKARQIAETNAEAITVAPGSTKNEIILKEDQEAWECITNMLMYLDTRKEADENLYEIPGVICTNPKTGQKRETTLFIKKEYANIIAAKAELYEKYLNLTFPNQIYQLKKGNIIPGESIKAPGLKTANQSYDEYEAELENHYKLHGIKKTSTNDIAFRDPYPHESIDYRQEKPEISTTGYVSEYYNFIVKENNKRELEMEEAEPNIDKGKFKIIKSEKLSENLLILKNLINSPTGKSKLTATLAGVGLVGSAFLIGQAFPGITIIGIGALSLPLIVKKVKGEKKGNNLLKKIKGLLKGRKKIKKPKPEPEEPNTADTDSEPVQQENEEEKLESFKADFEEHTTYLKELEAAKAILEDELQNTTLTDEEKKAKEETLKTINAEYLAGLMAYRNIIQQYIYPTQQNETGGPKL